MRKEKKLSEVFDFWFQKPEFKAKKLQLDVELAWKEMMSEAIQQATKGIVVTDSKIEISIRNPLLQKELHYAKTSLLKQFSEKANHDFTELIFK